MTCGNSLGIPRTILNAVLTVMESSFSMSSVASRPSEAFLSESEVKEKRRKEQVMLEFYQKNDCVYVGEQTINQCWGKIRPWVNISTLMGYLMKNGLVNNPDDMDAISSPYLTAAVRQTNLMQLLSANGGGSGHFLFYMSLCESLENNPLGHGDAVDELKRRAVELHEKPPWQREEEHRHTSLSSTNSYGTTLSSTDTSLEMGPRSLSAALSSSQTPPSSSSSSSLLSMDSSQATGRLSTIPTSSHDQSKFSVGHNIMQLPQRPPPSHGSPSGSNQSPVVAAAACFAQPKLEPSAQISMPSKTQVVYPVTGKAVPGVIFQPSWKTNIVQSTEPLSYSSTGSSSKSWMTPYQETEQWPDHSFSYDMDVERDSSSHQRQATSSGDGKTNAAKSMKEMVGTGLSLSKIEELVARGNIDSLSMNYDNVLDLECTVEANSSDFMDGACRFVCAVLNTRDAKRVGVFLGGVKETDSEGQPYCVEGVAFDEAVMKSIEQQFTRRLATVLHSRVGDLEKELTPEELSQATLKFVDSVQASEHCKCRVALLVVEPIFEVCKNRMYVCQFRESGGGLQTECYKRLEGETVHIRQQKKIAALKNFLNQNYPPP